MRVIYIAGPITGKKDLNVPAFFRAQCDLIKEFPDAIVHNPHVIGQNLRRHNPNPTWLDYMIACLPVLLGCNTIYMLPGWRRSRGARIEHFVASLFRLERWYEEDPFLWLKVVLCFGIFGLCCFLMAYGGSR